MVSQIPEVYSLPFVKLLIIKINSQHVDNNGRHIILNLIINGSPVILVNHYASNYEADQVKLLNDLTHVFDHLETTANTRFVEC